MFPHEGGPRVPLIKTVKLEILFDRTQRCPGLYLNASHPSRRHEAPNYSMMLPCGAAMLAVSNNDNQITAATTASGRDAWIALSSSSSKEELQSMNEGY